MAGLSASTKGVDTSEEDSDKDALAVAKRRRRSSPAQLPSQELSMWSRTAPVPSGYSTDIQCSRRLQEPDAWQAQLRAAMREMKQDAFTAAAAGDVHGYCRRNCV